MEIIELTEDNILEASNIYTLSWKAAYKDIIPQEYLDNLSLEKWTSILMESLYLSFLLKDNGKYIATSAVSAARDKEMHGWGEIVSFYVLPEYHNKGYGKKLFSYVSNCLSESFGFKNIYLWVLEENYHARTFYERNNFIPNGDKTTRNIAGKNLVEIRYINKS